MQAASTLARRCLFDRYYCFSDREKVTSLPTLCRHFYIHPRTNNCNFHAPFRYLLVPAALLLPTPAGVALGTLIIPLSTGVHLTAEPHPQEA
jgi:hypothetical protein